jgi:DNA-binding transcriptional ArsR family regulator
MNQVIPSLHKILKDNTRRKIILLLDEKGSLSYRALMDDLEVVSTGLLNYHLKVLGDLLEKDVKGRYLLSEKGHLASQLLIEFPYEGTLVKMRRWERKYWKGAIFVLMGILIGSLAAYLLGYISVSTLYLSLLGIVPVISIIYVFEHFMRDIVSEKIRSKYLKANYYARGLAIGLMLWFALIFILALTGFSRSIGMLGAFQIVFLIGSLAICCWLGSELNKWDNRKRKLGLAK